MVGVRRSAVLKGGASVPSNPYGTWSTTDKTANINLSNADLQASTTTTGYGTVRTNSTRSAGKFYWEFLVESATSSNMQWGLASSSRTLPILPGTANGYTVAITGSGQIQANGTLLVASIGTIASGTVIGVAANIDVKLAWFRLGAAGNWNGSATEDPVTNTGGITFASLVLPAKPFWTGAGVLGVVTFRNGSTAFSGAVPSDYTSGWLS